MKRKFLGVMTGAVLAATVIAGCGGAGGGASSFQYDPPPGGPTPPPQKTINFTIPAYAAGDQAVVVFTPVSGDEFDQAVNNIQVNSTQARQAGTTTVEAAKAADAAAVVARDFCGTHQAVLQFDERLAARGPISAEDLKPRDVSARFDGQPAGFTDTLITLTGTEITVTKMLDDASTVHCNVLAEGTPGNTVVTQAQALRLAQIFDATNPFDPNQPNAIGIYDRLTGLCGSEWRTNPSGGRDGDLRVNIVLMSNASIIGALGVVPFADQFSSSIDPTSNQGEFLYLNAQELAVPGGTDLENYGLYHTLAHEFLHVIQMNQKIGRNGTFPNFDPNTPNVNNSAYSLWERRTIAEGFAETAATLCGFGVARASDLTPSGGAEGFSIDAINLFLGGNSYVSGNPGLTTLGSNFWTPFLEFQGTDPYGMGHLFGLHILQRFGPQKWGELTSSPHIGLLNLNTVLGNQPENIFHSFNIALHVSTLVNAPVQYQFPFGLRLDNLNAVRPPKSNAAPVFLFLPGAGFAASSPATFWVDQNFAPWSTVLLRFLGGNGGAVNFEVTLPIRARAALVHESPAGTFSSVQAP